MRVTLTEFVRAVTIGLIVAIAVPLSFWKVLLWEGMSNHFAGLVTAFIGILWIIFVGIVVGIWAGGFSKRDNE